MTLTSNSTHSFSVSNQAPIILIDLPNLLNGRHQTFKDQDHFISQRLKAIEKCVHTLWSKPPKEKVVFSLEHFHPSLHTQCLHYGYELKVITPDQTETMELKKLSKLDDYALKRYAKSKCQEGHLDFLIVSADRDHEEIAYDMQAFAPYIVYTQWNGVTNLTHPDLFMRYPLQSFQSSSSQSSNGEGSSSSQHPRSPIPSSPQLKVIPKEGMPYLIDLKEGLSVGRKSRSQNYTPDFALDPWDQKKQYPRQTGEFLKVGQNWYFWITPRDTPLSSSIILENPTHPSYLLDPGCSAYLCPKESTLFFEEIQLKLQVIA